MKVINTKIKGGYTIIETMIAISLFIVIVMAGMGALLNANRVHNKSQDFMAIIDNLNFIMEDISTNLRTGSNYRCLTTDYYAEIPDITTRLSGQNCWGIAFEHQNGDPENSNDQWMYAISEGKIWKKKDIDSYGFSNDFYQLNPDDIIIDSVSVFDVFGAESFDSGDDRQPFVIIKLKGTIHYQTLDTPFFLQTSISQRNVDIF